MMMKRNGRRKKADGWGTQSNSGDEDNYDGNYEELNGLAELSTAFFGNRIPTMNELVSTLEQLPSVIDTSNRAELNVSPLDDDDEDDVDIGDVGDVDHEDEEGDDDNISINNDGGKPPDLRYDATDPAAYKIEDIFTELTSLCPCNNRTERREHLFNVLIQVPACACRCNIIPSH
jgi:hypothetical protein